MHNKEQHLINLIKNPDMYCRTSLNNEYDELRVLKGLLEDSIDEMHLMDDIDIEILSTNHLLGFIESSCKHAWHYDEDVRLTLHHGNSKGEIDMHQQLDNINRALEFVAGYLEAHYSGS